MQLQPEQQQELQQFLMQRFSGQQDPGQQQAVQQAEEQARRQRMIAGLGQAGSTIGAAIGGQQADTSFYDQMRQDADRQQQQAVQGAQQGDQQRMAVAQYLQSRADKGSEIARQQGNVDREFAFKGEQLGAQQQLAQQQMQQQQQEKRFKTETDLRKEVASLPEVDRLQKTVPLWNQMKTASPSFGGDQVRIRSLVQVIDPSGRFSDRNDAIEYAQDQAKPGGLFERFKNHILHGQELTDQQRRDLEQTARTIIMERQKEAEVAQQPFIEIAQQDGLRTDRIVREFAIDPSDLRGKFDQQPDPQDPFSDRKLMSRTALGAGQSFPMQVRKGDQMATVSSEQELKEARAEGWE